MLYFILGAVFGIFTLAMVSGRRPDDEFWDGYKSGYEKAKEEYRKLP